MRENRPSGSEGGATVIPSSLPLSIIQSLRDGTQSVIDTQILLARRNGGQKAAPPCVILAGIALR